MKILTVNTYDNMGGAARAAYRLHKSLLLKGVESSMLVQTKLSDDYTVQEYPESFFQKLLVKIRPAIESLPVRFYKGRTKTPFSSSWLGFNNVIDRINKINPDIVHLHWISNGMIKIEDLAKINAPIVWTLHDNCAFTGGCHIMWDCKNFKSECGHCPRLGSTKDYDLSTFIFRRKMKTFSKLPNMVFIGLSRWITANALNSALLKNHKIVNLPNPIDTNVFKPFEKESARELWNLPKNKKLVLFGAMSATSDINKGYKELTETLGFLNDKNVEFVVFGSSEPLEKQPFKMKTHYLGHLSDDVSIVTLYSAVDVMIVPSLQETLPQTATEAMACGTPVVAFAQTGLLDIIEHKKSGYLAKPFDTKDLAEGIQWVLNSENISELSSNAREKIVFEFDASIVTDKYIDLYKNILLT